MNIEYDVLVVGGGPGGCSAARAAAKHGLKVILIEEHPVIGEPVQCAEGIGKYLIPFLPFSMLKSLIRWKIKGMIFWTKDITLERKGGIWAGYTLDRKIWDQWLASMAKKEGTKIITNSKLINLDYTDDFVVRKAEAIFHNKKIKIEPKIVIAADGVESTIAHLLGIRKKGKEDIGEVKSYELKNLDLKYPHHDQLFLGDFAPNAYAYIFPISNRKANVGVGRVYDNKDMESLYNYFLEIPVVKKQVRNGKIVKEKSGRAPVKYTNEEWVYGNVIFTGDAANQNFKPFIEGNLPAVICGDIAGKISAYNIRYGTSIDEYKKIVYKKLGPLFKNSNNARDLLLKMKDLKNRELLYLCLFSNICSPKEIENLIQKDEYETIIKNIRVWKENRLKQLKTILIEYTYLFYLSVRRQIRRV